MDLIDRNSLDPISIFDLKDCKSELIRWGLPVPVGDYDDEILEDLCKMVIMRANLAENF